jgi:cyclopropane fatty-acyl-phospholipid synthase-like methyltransferase|mmetsp:Transcript_27434/g.44018  ORF Transcript_27434/g.44018 Transcript_27434/m.44018 type:complete len:254 (-) Transcript_27434:19-780(-)
MSLAIACLLVASLPSQASAVTTQVSIKSGGTVIRRETGASRTDIDPADYSDAYNSLYNRSGYHNDPEITHEAPWVKKLDEFSKTLVKDGSAAISSVIVLGCSHGKGASMLHGLGYNVWGVDVAWKAIDMARTLRGNTCGTQTEQCFLEGSLTKIPYASDKFDAGMSSDVLEHIAPEDVPTVVHEISRVVKKYLLLSIADFKERGKNGEKAGMGNLHLSVQGPQYWKDQFAKEGWKLQEDMSTKDYVNLLLKRV